MDICLLTAFHTHHTRSSFIHRLAEEAQKKNVKLHLINPAEVSMSFDNGNTVVMYHGQPLPKYDLTHYALRWDDEHTWNVVETLRAQGYFTVPSQRMPLGDTVTMARLFSKVGIKTPRTWVLPHANQVPLIMQELYFPCVFRVRRGQKGRSVYKVAHMGEALNLADQLARSNLGLVVQEILAPIGTDVRAMVVGDTVIASLERTASNGYLRPAEDNNLQVTATTLSPAEKRMVLAAAKLYHAPYAAVNFIRRPEGPVLLEVARAPALGEIERFTGLNVADLIVTHLLELAKKSDTPRAV